MDLKIIEFYAVILLLIVISYLFLKTTRKGEKCFFIIFGMLLTINISHFIYVQSLPPSSGFLGNIGLAIGYFMATIFEILFLFLFSLVWFVVVRRKIKSKNR